MLQDDLFISNTSNSTRTSGSIQIKGTITGAGNIWIENVSDDSGHGQVAFTNNQSRSGIGGFDGNTTIAKGAVTFSRGDCFTPTPGNVVTIGAGMGDAALTYVGASLGNMENNFVVAANTGANVLRTSSAATGLVNFKSSNSFAASFTLDGNLALVTGGTGTLQIGDPITGVGRVTALLGNGPVRLTNANSYTGGTRVIRASLSVGHTDAINNGVGFYVATDGTLGPGNVDVQDGVLEIESGVAGVDVIANTATVTLSGLLQLGSGVNERVGGLWLGGVRQTAPGTYGSTSSGATFQNDFFFSGPGVITLSADFNSDGLIDAADYVAWRKSPASVDGWHAYENWRANFGNTPPPGAGSSLGSHSVPEPGTILLLVAGIVFTCIEQRR